MFDIIYVDKDYDIIYGTHLLRDTKTNLTDQILLDCKLNQVESVVFVLNF